MYFTSESSTQAFSLHGSLNDTSPFKVLQSPWPPIKGSVDFIQVERLSFRKSLYKAAEQEPGIMDPDACAFFDNISKMSRGKTRHHKMRPFWKEHRQFLES